MDRKGYFLPVKPINLVCPGTHQVGAGRPQPRMFFNGIGELKPFIDDYPAENAVVSFP
jgi:hypothetical protein